MIVESNRGGGGCTQYRSIVHPEKSKQLELAMAVAQCGYRRDFVLILASVIDNLLLCGGRSADIFG
jgi:transcriptional regulator CtsR